MGKCNYCSSTLRQVKAGLNKSGSQRYLCHACQRIYTPQATKYGCSQLVRLLVMKMYFQRRSQSIPPTVREIASTFSVSPQSVLNWSRAYMRNYSKKFSIYGDTFFTDLDVRIKKLIDKQNKFRF